MGKASTHCRIGTRGITEPTRCAAVAAMRLVVHDGHTPRPLQEKERDDLDTRRSRQPDPPVDVTPDYENQDQDQVW